MSKLATQSDKERTIFQTLVTFAVQGCGVGRIPFMPGTWGSLVGLILVYILSMFALSIAAYVLMTLSVCLLSWWLIFLYEKKSHTHDESSVVIDEIAGIFVCFLGIPIILPTLVAGFVLFRIFDIAKPFPISWMDRKIPGAHGTLLDDLAAGAVVCGLLHALLHFASSMIGGH